MGKSDSSSPGSEKHEPDYTSCGGGFKDEWYECEACGQPCDADGNSIEIHEPTGSHHLVEIPAKDPTYEEDGNSAYWVCSDCQALFKDAEGTTPIEDESEIVIPKLDKPNEKPDETPDETPEKPAVAPAAPSDPDDTTSIDKAPQTGVNNPLFWGFAALLCGGIVLACLAENKKRNR